MKKNIQIVTVPLDKESWSKGNIVEFETKSANKNIAIAKVPSDKFGISVSPEFSILQLLVLSDDEIQEGDWVQFSVLNKPTHLIGIEWEDYKAIEFAPGECMKVIASYPQIEGTLPISKETIQAWIDAGTPEEGVIFYDNEPDNLLFDTQGNLLLEFEPYICPGCTEGCEECCPPKPRNSKLIHKDIDKLPYPELVEEISKYYKDVPIVDKPSIPTQEEIEKTAKKYAKRLQLPEYQKVAEQSWLSGYQQALKDLGYLN